MNKNLLIGVEGFIAAIVGEVVLSILGSGGAGQTVPDPTTPAGQHALILAAFLGILLGLKRLTATTLSTTP